VLCVGHRAQHTALPAGLCRQSAPLDRAMESCGLVRAPRQLSFTRSRGRALSVPLGPLRLACRQRVPPGTVVRAAERRWVWVRATPSHLELDVFVVDRFHIEADRGDGGHHLAYLQTVCRSHAHPTAPTTVAPLSSFIFCHPMLLCVCTAQLRLPPRTRQHVAGDS
jgi:hypothetical protein